MKLLRYGPAGNEKPGMLDNSGRVRAIDGPDFAGEGVSLARMAALRDMDVESLPIVGNPGRIGACLASVSNFYCIGLNYARHAAETGAAAPTEPILFSKQVPRLPRNPYCFRRQVRPCPVHMIPLSFPAIPPNRTGKLNLAWLSDARRFMWRKARLLTMFRAIALSMTFQSAPSRLKWAGNGSRGNPRPPLAQPVHGL